MKSNEGTEFGRASRTKLAKKGDRQRRDCELKSKEGGKKVWGED